MGYRLVGHPPDVPSKRIFFDNDETLPELPFLVRNRAIGIPSVDSRRRVDLDHQAGEQIQ
jgi:hypothetical protein